jgi:primase-polymerase (primpol)-like protein
MIPDELKALAQWVVWRLEERGKELRKVPYSPKTGRGAATTKLATWATFEMAQQVLAKGGYSGLGFVFSKDDPYCGIDLDKCIDENGEVEPWALEIVRRLDSYTEFSPSGHGLHIFVRASLPEGGRKKGQVEMYDQARYFTVTGRRFECPA